MHIIFCIINSSAIKYMKDGHKIMNQFFFVNAQICLVFVDFNFSSQGICMCVCWENR